MNIHLLNKTRIMTKKFAVVALALMSVMTTEVSAQTSSQKSAVLVSRSKQVITKTTATDTVSTTRTTNDKVTFDYKKEAVDGNAIAFDNKNKDIEGKKLSRAFIALAGGANFQFSGSEFRPEGRILLGRESKDLVFFADLFLSGKKQNESDELTDNGVRKGADFTGTYLDYGGKLNVGFKLLQDARYRNWLAIYGGAGYGFSKTDGDQAQVVSSNSGFLFGGGILGKASLTDHWGIIGQLEFGNVVKCYHDSDQKLDNFALKALLGLSYTF
jgi:hypothetical protein